MFKKSQWKIKLIFILTYCLVFSFVFEIVVSRSSQAITQKSEWYSWKLSNYLHFRGLGPIYEFVKERQTLSSDKLNLHDWGGFNDVVYKSEFPNFEKYRIKFSLEETNSYFWFFYNCDSDQCQGLRISNSDNFPSGFFVVNNSGKFLKTIEFSTIFELGHYELEFSRIKKQIHLLINNRQIIFEEPLQLPFFPLRLRGAINASQIDSIEVTDANQNTKIIDFTPSYDSQLRWNVFFFLGGLLIALTILFWFLRINFFYLVMVLMSLFCILIGYFLFDKYYWRNIYFDSQKLQTSRQLEIDYRFEKWRQSLVKDFESEDKYNASMKKMTWFPMLNFTNTIPEDFHMNQVQLWTHNGEFRFISNIEEYVNENKDNNSNLKLGFLGGSQLWGAGASDSKFTLGYLISEQIHKKTGMKVESINFSHCGHKLSDLLNRKKIIEQYKPDLLFISLGVNDSGTDDKQFEFMLENMIQGFTKVGIRVVLNIEPLFDFTGAGELGEAPRMSAVRRVAKRLNLPLLNLHGYLKSKKISDSGLLWHDIVHLTDYGQQLGADYITKVLLGPNVQLLEQLDKTQE